MADLPNEGIELNADGSVTSEALAAVRETVEAFRKEGVAVHDDPIFTGSESEPTPESEDAALARDIEASRAETDRLTGKTREQREAERDEQAKLAELGAAVRDEALSAQAEEALAQSLETGVEAWRDWDDEEDPNTPEELQLAVLQAYREGRHDLLEELGWATDEETVQQIVHAIGSYDDQRLAAVGQRIQEAEAAPYRIAVEEAMRLAELNPDLDQERIGEYLAESLRQMADSGAASETVAKRVARAVVDQVKEETKDEDSVPIRELIAAKLKREGVSFDAQTLDLYIESRNGVIADDPGVRRWWRENADESEIEAVYAPRNHAKAVWPDMAPQKSLRSALRSSDPADRLTAMDRLADRANGKGGILDQLASGVDTKAGKAEAEAARRRRERNLRETGSESGNQHDPAYNPNGRR